MAFGSNSFPLGPRRVIKQRINSFGNEIYPPEQMEDAYSLGGEAQLPATEKDYHSSVGRVKDRMKTGTPNKHSMEYDDIDRFRPKYAQKFSLRKQDEQQARYERMHGNNEWLKRRKQRFPGLETVGYERQQVRRPDKIKPATGMSGVGFFGKHGALGDIEQKYQEDMNMMLKRHRSRF